MRHSVAGYKLYSPLSFYLYREVSGPGVESLEPGVFKGFQFLETL